jgi:hypothetical protein
MQHDAEVHRTRCKVRLDRPVYLCKPSPGERMPTLRLTTRASRRARRAMSLLAWLGAAVTGFTLAIAIVRLA